MIIWSFGSLIIFFWVQGGALFATKSLMPDADRWFNHAD
jgi:hypothetical protein